MTENIRFIDLFGGIGGFRLGLENTSEKFKCVAYYDKDEYAVKSYNAIFNENHEPTDVTQLDAEQVPDHDILCAGFPCQAFSTAGKREGLEDTRGTLFFEIARVARTKEPEILFLENVKGLLNHDDGETFRIFLETLDELGYDAQWQVLNSKFHGVPQNRERIFIIAHRREQPRPEVFPITEPNQGTNRESEAERERQEDKGINMLGNINPSGRGMNGKVYEASEETVAPTVTTNKGEGHKILDFSKVGDLDYVGALADEDEAWLEKDSDKSRGHHEGNRVYSVAGVSPTLATNKGGASGNSQVVLDVEPMCINHQMRPESRPSIEEEGQSGGSGILYNKDGYSYALSSSPHFITSVEPVHTPDFVNKNMNMKSRIGSSDGSMFTVEATSQHGVVEEIEDNMRIRKLTPRECWRLQGFPDWAFDRALEVNSNTQLYKQAGNSVTVDVVEDIAEKLLDYFGETDR